MNFIVKIDIKWDFILGKGLCIFLFMFVCVELGPKQEECAGRRIPFAKRKTKKTRTIGIKLS